MVNACRITDLIVHARGILDVDHALPIDLPYRHGQDRLCWLTQKRAEMRADTQRSKARETEPMSLVTRTHLALEIGHRDLTNRVGLGHVCPGQRCAAPTHRAAASSP